MKCNILLKEAIDGSIVSPEERAALNAAKPKAVSGYSPKTGVGIDINSKLETALTKINKQHGMAINKEPMFRPETIRKLLQREGVSNKEIDFKLGELLEGKEKISILDIMDEAHAKRLYIQDTKTQFQNYAHYTYNKQGLTTSDYQVRHLMGDGMPGGLVNDHFTELEGSRGWARQYPGKYFENGKTKEAWRLDEIQSDLFQTTPPNQMKELIKLTGVDYPDVKKILIVDALDQAIKHGYDTMVIPITRSANYLTGSINVSNIYRDLNTGILPKIRKELDKVDLKLDIKHAVDKQELIEGAQLHAAFMGNPRLQYNEEDWREIYGYFGAEIDDININQQDFKKFIIDVSNSIMPENIRILKEIGQELFNPESFVISIKDKTGKPLFTKESYVPSVLHSKSREMAAFVDMMKANEVLTHKASYFIKYSNSDLKLSEILDRSLPEDKEQITKIWETAAKYEKVNKEKGIKYRWDALSILSALGLEEGYQKLKEES